MTEASEYGTVARAVTAATGSVAATVQDTHRAIARRVPLLRLLPRPVRAMHERGTTLVYLCVRGAVAAVGAAAAVALDTAPRTRAARPWSASPRGRRLAGMIDGAFGSHLDPQHHPGLAGAMSVHVDGTPIALDADSVARHHPAAGGTLVVLLHGLIETEQWWGGTEDDFGARLHRDLGATCVRVRYNSGQPVARSGAELDAVLDRLVSAWPVPVGSVALVGHSMGGLVARHALLAAAERGHAWPSRVHHLVSLGTPHLGSPVERGAQDLVGLLSRFAETAPLAALLDSRSDGIKDMATGWTGHDATPVTLHRGNIAATLSRDPANLLGRAVGDLLVQPHSALPTTPPARAVAVGGIGHFALLSDDSVYTVVRDWLREHPPHPGRPRSATPRP